MTTYQSSINLQHTTDIEFNHWVNRFVDGLTAIGMVQTADTGQTSFGSPLIPIPGTNTDAGFQIWRFDDAQHAAGNPLICRFDFGTDATAGDAAIDITVGTTTDGAGTMTGSVADTFELHSNLAPATPKTGPIFMCHAEGFLGIYFGKGAMSNPAQPRIAWFTGFVCRSTDADGVPDSEAFFITTQHLGGGQTGVYEQCPAHQSVDYASGTVHGVVAVGNGVNPPFGFLPSSNFLSNNTATNEAADGSIAIFPCFGVNPHPFPVPQLVWGWAIDIPENLTFTATPVGTTQHTYMAQSGMLMGPNGAAIEENQGINAMMAFIWE